AVDRRLTGLAAVQSTIRPLAPKRSRTREHETGGETVPGIDHVRRDPQLRKPSLPRSPSHWYEHGEPVASALGRTSHERKARQVSLHHARSHVMTENSKLMSRRELMQVGLAAGMVALPSRALGQTSGDVITRPIPSSGE